MPHAPKGLTHIAGFMPDQRVADTLEIRRLTAEAFHLFAATVETLGGE